MVAEARRISSSSVLFLDADETLSANVLTSLEWKRFVASEPGTVGYFLWVQLFGSVKRYIAHGKAGMPTHLPFAFVDDGCDVADDTIMRERLIERTEATRLNGMRGFSGTKSTCFL